MNGKETELKNGTLNSCRDVEIRVDFLRIGEIDTMTEKYTCEVMIESKWTETNTSIEKYDASKHWNPKLYIQNALNEPKESNTYDIQAENNCLKITETKIIRGQFWERIELYDFPFDLQQLNLIIKTKLASSEINFIANTDNYSLVNLDAKRTFTDQQKWQLLYIVKLSDSIVNKNKPLESNKVVPVSNDYKINIRKPKSPKLIATFYCSRHPGFYIFNAFFLIFLITASSLTVFAISCKLPTNRLPTTFTILLSSISFKWVVNRSLPPVAYLTLLDKYSILCIFFINVLAAWHGIIGTFHPNWTDFDRIDFGVMIAFMCIFVLIHVFGVVWYFIITRHYRFLKRQETNFVKDYLKKNNKKQIFDEEEDEKDEFSADEEDELKLN